VKMVDPASGPFLFDTSAESWLARSRDAAVRKWLRAYLAQHQVHVSSITVLERIRGYALLWRAATPERGVHIESATRPVDPLHPPARVLACGAFSMGTCNTVQESRMGMSGVELSRMFLLLAAVSVTSCSTAPKRSASLTYGLEEGWLSAKPFGESPDVLQFFEKQKKRHALLMEDMKDTQRMFDDVLGPDAERLKANMVLPALGARQYELDAMLAGLPNVTQWSPGQRQEVRAFLEEELRWVDKSIDRLASIPGTRPLRRSSDRKKDLGFAAKLSAQSTPNIVGHISSVRTVCAYDSLTQNLETNEVLFDILARSSTSNRRAGNLGIP
jgi:hypothetical protein